MLSVDVPGLGPVLTKGGGICGYREVAREGTLEFKVYSKKLKQVSRPEHNPVPKEIRVPFNS